MVFPHFVGQAEPIGVLEGVQLREEIPLNHPLWRDEDSVLVQSVPDELYHVEASNMTCTVSPVSGIEK